MHLTTQNGITTRNDGLPYDILKIENGYQFRATGNPKKPVVLATTTTHYEALQMLILQAPEQGN